jgi:hypothetical protein
VHRITAAMLCLRACLFGGAGGDCVRISEQELARWPSLSETAVWAFVCGRRALFLQNGREVPDLTILNALARDMLIDKKWTDPLIAVVDGLLLFGHDPHPGLSKHLVLMLNMSREVPYGYKLKDRKGTPGPQPGRDAVVGQLLEMLAVPRWPQNTARLFRAMLVGPQDDGLWTPYWLELVPSQKRARGKPPGGNPTVLARNKVYADYYEHRTKVDGVSPKDVFAEMDRMHGDTTDSGRRHDGYWRAISEWGGKSPSRAAAKPKRKRRIPKKKKAGRR